jgi:beta-hydroxylase
VPGRAADERRERRVGSVTTFFFFKLGLLGAFITSVLWLHFRGRERMGFRRQLTDHSTFFAPYTALMALFSKVPRRPILDARDFPELAVLRERWQTIRDEAARLHEGGGIRASERFDDVGFNSFFRKGWKRFYLKWYGAPLPSARRLCPQTVALVESLGSVHGAMFALIGPHGKVGNHRDPFAGSLRYHLGLITPNSDDCRIFIDGTPYSWRDGQDLVFDETYVHRFENLTDQPRIILFCDLERPLHNPLVRAVNRALIRWVVGMTATKNVDGEKVGAVNRVFDVVYRVRPTLKRLKRANRTLYYAVKYALIAALVHVVLFAGVGPLRHVAAALGAAAQR